MQVTLTEVQRIPTSGARAVELVHVGGRELLAVPQLARDIPGGSPGMNGGDSDTDLLLLDRAGGRLEPWATLAAPGRISSRPRPRSSNGARTGSPASRKCRRSRPSSGGTGRSAAGTSSGWPR